MMLLATSPEKFTMLNLGDSTVLCERARIGAASGDPNLSAQSHRDAADGHFSSIAFGANSFIAAFDACR
jgi:hypothetical protein